MARNKWGDDSMVKQGGSGIAEDGNGLLTSAIAWQGDAAKRTSIPIIGDKHPDDHRLRAHRRDREIIGLGRERWTVHFIGISQDPTNPVVNWPGGYGREPIETHEEFADFAGTIAAPLNGASFRPFPSAPDKHEFAGFLDTLNKKYGIQDFYKASDAVSVTYWTAKFPSLPTRMTRYKPTLKGFRAPAGVKNWLYTGSPYRQTPDGALFQVTEQFLGSGALGWDSDIYPSGDKNLVFGNPASD